MAENDVIANKNMRSPSNLQSNQCKLFFIRNCWGAGGEQSVIQLRLSACGKNSRDG